MAEPAEDRTAEVTAFSARARWLGVRSSDVADWLAARRTLVTASDVAAIMGEDERRSALEVYVDKRVERPPEELAIDDPRWLGSIVEQPILSNVARRRGWQYRPGGALLVSRAHPELGATLDAEVDRGDGLWCDFEGKTTELSGEWDGETGQMPTRVLIQVQTQLLVSGAPVGIVFAWLRRWKVAQIEVYPSEALHEIIVERAEWFMDLVRRKQRPDPDGSESAKRALQHLYGDGDGSTAPLPDAAREWTERYIEINAELARLAKQKRHVQNMLKAHIGEATYGTLEGEPIEGKGAWKWTRGDKGRLIPVKQAPRGLKVLPPVKVASLADRLEESVEHASKVIPIKRTRRRARR